MIDVMKKIDEIGELYKEGKFEKCVQEVELFWSSLPEPKENIKNSYLLIEYGARICLVLKDYNSAMDWALKSLKYIDIRNKMGESEFLIGMVAFEMNDLEKAKEYFLIAKKKSGGRAFIGEDPRYKNLIK